MLRPIILNGTEMGVVEQGGTEIHFVINDKYKNVWATHRNAIREFMQYYLDQDFITTNTTEDDIRGIKRILILGFEETWRSDGHVFFMLKTLPFERKQNAAQ